VRRIVYAASGASRYGAQEGLPVDESCHVDPLSPHAVGKLAGEIYLRAYAEMYGLAPICLALANVYGPRQSPHGAAGVIAILDSAMVTGRPLWVYREGAAAHDCVYVDDVVDAFVRAGGTPLETTGTYNIGTGRHTTLTEIHGLMSAVLDGASPPSPNEDRGDELNAIALNATKAAKELEWSLTVDIAEGIRRTMRWLCASSNLRRPHSLSAPRLDRWGMTRIGACAQPVSASLQPDDDDVLVEVGMGVGPVGFGVEQQDLIWAMWRRGDAIREMERTLGETLPRIRRYLPESGGSRRSRGSAGPVI
jgi:hypothetical protein